MKSRCKKRECGKRGKGEKHYVESYNRNAFSYTNEKCGKRMLCGLKEDLDEGEKLIFFCCKNENEKNTLD